MDQHLNQWQSYIILLNAVKTRPDWTTLSGLLLPIQRQNSSSVFPKYTVDHSCNISGKFWSPVLALLWTQEALSKLALRALSDLESPRTDWSRNGQPSAYQHTNKWRSILKSTEHLKFVTLCFCLSYITSKRLPRTAAPPPSSRRDIPELSFLPSRGYPAHPASLHPNTQTTAFPSKHSLVTVSLNLNCHVILKGEQGSTK